MQLRDLLIQRLLLINAMGAAALAYAFHLGLVQMVFEADASKISYGILALLAIGLASVFSRAIKVSQSLNRIKSGKNVAINGPKFLAKGDHIADLAGWIVTLGLVGTVVGFVMALNGIDADGDPKAIIGQLIGGMGTAFYTTLAGALAGLWLEVNSRILKTATVSMLEDASK